MNMVLWFLSTFSHHSFLLILFWSPSSLGSQNIRIKAFTTSLAHHPIVYDDGRHKSIVNAAKQAYTEIVWIELEAHLMLLYCDHKID